MKVSLNWIRYYNDMYQMSADPAPAGVDALVEKIGAQLGAVEEKIDLGLKYQGIVVIKVVSCQKHPNADKLRVCLIDDNKAVRNVKRNKSGLVEVVCGAPNVKAGMLAVWIPPEHIVPSTFDKEPFALEAREIRGIVSSGMLASAKELGLGDDHTGIVEIDQDLKPGSSLAKAYRLDDHIIDIENKMFTHRPDLFGQLGIAREIAGIHHHSFKSPEWYREDADIKQDGRNNRLKLMVENEVPRLVPRFCAVVIKDVKIKDSPLWLRAQLSAVGIRPINNIVDLTNYYMMLTAQPLHAYDYEKVKTGILGVRYSKKGETLKVIGGKEIKLHEGAIVITDGTNPIGLAGVMGGSETEVDKSTRSIILECANFDMNATRHSALVHGLFTDAATRFTKNQSPRQNKAIIAKAADDVLKIAGGRVSTGLIDDIHFRPRDVQVKTSTEFINTRLGLVLAPTEIKKIMENVEFRVSIKGSNLLVSVPFWRTDIGIPEDLVEEIGRLYGFDHLPKELPEKDLQPAQRNVNLDLKQNIREILSSAGANEVLTYSFVNENLLKVVGQDAKKAFKIANALSPDLQYYRLSITPSLLEKVHANIKNGFDEFVLFEIGKGHIKGLLDKQKLPVEPERLSLIFASKSPKEGSPYYWAKVYCEYLIFRLGLEGVDYEPLELTSKQNTVTYYEPTRAANIKIGERIIGRIGEIEKTVKARLKLPDFTAGFDLHTDELANFSSPTRYRPLNRFPSLDQDLTLRSGANRSYAELTVFLDTELRKLSKDHGYNYEIKPLDIFRRSDEPSHVQTTWRISIQHPERTLTTEEANKLLDKIAVEAKAELNAQRA